MKWSVRRAFQAVDGRGMRVLSVGCGDGRWEDWLAGALGVRVLGTDALEYPKVRKRVSLFLLADAEELDRFSEVRRFHPAVVLYLNSLEYMTDWRRAVHAGAQVGAPYVICFDNFMTPTPDFRKNLSYCRPIELPQIIEAWETLGYRLVAAIPGDWFHRKLFLKTPRWMHPVVALLSVALDWCASYLLPPLKARHVAVVFERR